jgi:hypothetical protein
MVSRVLKSQLWQGRHNVSHGCVTERLHVDSQVVIVYVVGHVQLDSNGGTPEFPQFFTLGAITIDAGATRLVVSHLLVGRSEYEAARARDAPNGRDLRASAGARSEPVPLLHP